MTTVFDRPAALWSRRSAFRLAASSVPTVALMTLPAMAGQALAATTPSAPYIKPTAANTGVRIGSTLTAYRGDIVVTTPGTVIENKDIYGFVRIRAANVTIRNCRVRGSGPAGYNTGLIDCNHHAVRNALIEDCLLVPDFPSVWLDGVIGKEYTARRCNVYNTVDGFGVYNSTDRSAPTNVTIESCYIHDLSYFAVDPNHGYGPTHNDCIQIQGGSNVRVRGNTIACFMSKTAGNQNYEAINIGQGVLIQPNLAPVVNSDISYNWIDGGKVGLYFVLGSQPTQLFGSCTGNRFGTSQYRFGGTSAYEIRVKRGVTFTNSLTANYWDSTGAVFKESSTGGIRYDA